MRNGRIEVPARDRVAAEDRRLAHCRDRASQLRRERKRGSEKERTSLLSILERREVFENGSDEEGVALCLLEERMLE